MIGLDALLAGREERVLVQKSLLAGRCACAVVQASLNIPGLPKTAPGDAEALLFAARALSQSLGRAPDVSAALTNGAGPALYMVYSSLSPRKLKLSAVEIEESADWTRVLDIDVITEDGAVSRGGLELPPRRCLLCGEDAKICARAGTHAIQDLRAESARLLSRLLRASASAR